MTDDSAWEPPARGTLEDRVAEIRSRMENVTPGPWFVWDGIGYFGGGKDLCIGAGPTWLANMDHRCCDMRTEHHIAGQILQGNVKCAPEADTRIVTLAETCDLDEQFTAEQIADANFIARAREDIPFLLSAIAYLNREINELSAENFKLRHRDAE